FLFRGEQQHEELLSRELAAAHSAGLASVAWLDRLPGSSIDVPCLRFPGQAQFHPLRYVAGLAAAVERLGGRISCDTHATEVVESERNNIIRTDAGPSIRAECVVVATNS